MPLLPSALPPKGEARRYVANDFLKLNSITRKEGCDTRIPYILKLCGAFDFYAPHHPL